MKFSEIREYVSPFARMVVDLTMGGDLSGFVGGTIDEVADRLDALGYVHVALEVRRVEIDYRLIVSSLQVQDEGGEW